MTMTRALERVVVTGATGFIGSHLTRALAEHGTTVIAIDRREPAAENPVRAQEITGALRITADLRNCALEPLLAEADTVFHLAGQPGVRTSWGNGFPDYLADNLLVTHRLAECTTKLGIPRLILASSSSVYGPTTGTPSRETDATHPISPYAISKLAAEALCAAHCGQSGHLTEAIALRYFTVYGPGQREDMLIHRALTAALTGEPVLIYGHGHQQRDFTYVHDTIAATIAAATCPRPPPIVNIGSGHAVTLTELFDTITQVTGHHVPTRAAPVEQGDVTATLADPTLAHHTLGWHPKATLASGIAEQWTNLTACLTRPAP
jgi:UDP-glucuronate 4-epimerase